MERLRKQMQFIMEIDKLKQVFRQSYVSDGTRKENDTEHSWSLAMMCIILSEYAPENIDVLHTMKMVLVHDIVEIDAGDTYAYDSSAILTQREREEAAADRIFNILPKDQAIMMRELWEEFEKRETAEAKFARAIDNIQPLMLNDATCGRAWREHEVPLSKVLGRNKYTKEGGEMLWEYAKELIYKNVAIGNIIDDGGKDD